MDSAGRHLVLLLDRSASMRESDPQDAARVGASLALALAGSRDNVAVISYAAEAEVRVPLQPAGDTATRARLDRGLEGLARGDVTNFAAALGRAREVLEAGRSPPGSAILLLTDGIPFRPGRGALRASTRSTEGEVQALAARGWRIFAVALGRQAATPFLARLVAETGGSVVTATTAAGLLEAFEEVAVEALGYLRAERGAEPVLVVPQTRRLAFLGRWAEAGAVGELRHDDRPVAPARAVRFPGEGAGPFGVVLVDEPEPGVWSAGLPGVDQAVALLEPGFALGFRDGFPPAEVDAGRPFQLEVVLEGDPARLATLRGRLRLRVRLLEQEQPRSDWIPLRPEAGDPNRLRCRLTAPPVTADAALRLLVEAELREGERPYVLRRSRVLAVRAPRRAADGTGPQAPTPLTLTVSPASVRRVAWADQELDPIELALRGDARRSLKVSVPDGADPLELEPGASATARVPCPPASGALTLRGEGPDAASVEARVEVVVERHRLRGPERLELRATPAGFACRPPAGLSLEPAGPLALEPGPLAGPEGAPPLTVELEGEGVLRVEPPETAPPGVYRGTLLIRAGAVPELAPRRLEVSLQVLPAWRPPPPIQLDGSWGWTSQVVELSHPSADEVEVELAATALVQVLPAPEGEPARIDPELDVRIRALDGWSGERLGLTPRRVALQVFLSSDLPAGTYEGGLDMIGPGTALRIPVRLEVRR